MTKLPTLLFVRVVLTLAILNAVILALHYDQGKTEFESWILIISFLGGIGALFGLVATFKNVKSIPMSPSGAVEWERQREKGKWTFVRDYFLLYSPLIIVGLLVSVGIDLYRGVPLTQQVESLVLAGCAGVGGSISLGLFIWSNNEREYMNIVSRQDEK